MAKTRDATNSPMLPGADGPPDELGDRRIGVVLDSGQLGEPVKVIRHETQASCLLSWLKFSQAVSRQLSGTGNRPGLGPVAPRKIIRPLVTAAGSAGER